MTKRLFGIILLIISVGITILLGINYGSTPSIGKLLSPTHGFWSNIESEPEANEEMIIDAVHGKVSVIYDENHVPHIFADNDEDLYYAQGYVMAKDRLWQMEFISLVASGRLTEIVGEKALPLDRYHRRIGLKRAAELSVPILMEDPMTQKPVQAFTDGVNAFIKKAKRGNLPIEYKILGYQPEEWKPVNCALLLKYMSNDLTGTDNDIEYTNAIKILGREVFDQLYPDYPTILDPIIPLETAFNFTPLKAPTPPAKSKDTSSVLALYKNPIQSFLPQRGLGSNNWAVSGTKTASGKPILCNDPHLGLTFPSIWYEMQLNAPGINVYGVTLPGSPGIVIGYNKKIAWGVTNAGMDIRDWFTVQRDVPNGKKYRINNEWKEFEEVHEVYKVKGGKDFSEDIKWTEVGPVVYDQDFDTRKDKQDLAMSWIALNATNDLKTFHLLNRANNHQDYLDALDQYWCPAQNFVYADVENNIAIKEQGRFWIRYYEQGKFLQDLSTANVKQIKSYFIPNDQTPYVLNPERGFVSSANQIPVGKEYPYYILGFQYENFRNRRINEFLAQTKEITIDDMKKLQYDNLSVLARDILPFMISNTHVPDKLEYIEVMKLLAKWNYMTDYESNAASYFYKWWDEFEKLTWDELANTDDASFIFPEQFTLIDIMKSNPEFSMFDIQATSNKETLKDVLRISLDSTLAFFETHPEEKEFRFYKNTSISHLLKFDAFSEKFIKIGGYANIVNATSSRWGASVRFIIDFKDGQPQGYGMYPGGQSGNPGSSAYKTFVEPWVDGKYFKHQFFNSKNDALKIVNN